MLLILSPSKTQDFECRQYEDYSLPALLDESRSLIDRLKELTQDELSTLMKISEKLSSLNRQRYQNFALPFTQENARQAIFAFKGDVYNGIDSDNYTDEDLQFCQGHVRILSGLYGILKPLDLIQPYRLEMGTKLVSDRGKNLYEFWGNKVTDLLNNDFAGEAGPVLVNLASNEYYKAIQPKRLQAEIITIAFKENKNSQYKVIGLFAKRARGLMTDYVIKNKISEVEKLKSFNKKGYTFREELSSSKEWVFCRD
ncbi:MAG: peroxide stress protein YaaA [Desulfobulbaceae bacterium]|nr:peroxide stress protein YaaA [Desulfobulbaceae bacterium]